MKVFRGAFILAGAFLLIPSMLFKLVEINLRLAISILIFIAGLLLVGMMLGKLSIWSLWIFFGTIVLVILSELLLRKVIKPLALAVESRIDADKRTSTRIEKEIE